jgi:integrase
MARGTIVTRTTENGEKRYHTVIRINGKQQWKTFERKKDAEDYLDRNSTDVRDGTYREIKKLTFGKYAEHWKTTNLIPQKLKPSTINGYGSILETHLIPEFGPSAMQAIDAARISAFEARLLQKKDFSRKSVRNVLTLLGRLFKNARKDGYLKVSPMIDMDKPTFEKENKGRALKADESQKLLSQSDENLRLIVLLALLSGVRRAELFALAWTDQPSAPRSYIDFDANKICIRNAVFFRYGKHQVRPEGEQAFTFVAPKSKASVRDIPLSPALKRELLARRLRSQDKTGLIFQTAKGTPLDPNNVCRWIAPPEKETEENREQDQVSRLYSTFNAAVRAAKIGKVRFHDLRHTYGSVLRDQRTDYYDIKRWMGHSSIQVTIDIYGQPLNDRGQEAAAKADAFLFGTKVAAD